MRVALCAMLFLSLLASAACGWPETVGPDGKLYTRGYEPYPHVRRYRVVINGS